MSEELGLTAEDLFNLIDKQSVSARAGVKLIENYGIRQAEKAIGQIRQESGLTTDREIEERITHMQEMLDQCLASIVDGAIRESSGK